MLAGKRGRVSDLREAAEMDLVVHATPAGMRGSAAAAVDPSVPTDQLGPGQVVVDLVYEPAVTAWLSGASLRGATTLGGLGMLVHQAAAQIERWTTRAAPLDAMWAAASAAIASRAP